MGRAGTFARVAAVWLGAVAVVLSTVGAPSAASTAVTLEPVAAGRAAVDGDAIVRFEQGEILRAVGEGALRTARLRVEALAPGRAVEPLATFVVPASTGAASAPAATDAAADVDVTPDVQAFLDGARPNYGWRVPSDPRGGSPARARLILDVEPPVAARGMLRVADDRWNFAWSATGQPFVPRGANYFGPFGDGQLEDAWDEHWDLVEEDFARMAGDALNVVRVHLQFGQFVPEAFVVDERHLVKLDQLIGLARRHGLVLDVTGLAHYRAADIPAWFGALDDEVMIAVEAHFWDTVARRYARLATIFCYDVQNEPLVSFEDRPGEVVGKSVDDYRWHYTNFHFQHVMRYWRAWLPEHVGFWRWLVVGWRSTPLGVALRGPATLPGRPETWRFVHELARSWTTRMASTIRARDPDRLVTVGLVPWSLPFHADLYSGWAPLALGGVVDFIAIHIYPGHPESTPDEARLTVRAAWVGMPVVLEETQAYLPTLEQRSAYFRWTLTSASGWFGFYLPPRWNAPAPADIGSNARRVDRYEGFQRFVTTEVPADGVHRQPADVTVEIPVAELRSGVTGPEARRRLVAQFHELDAAGKALDVVLR